MATFSFIFTLVAVHLLLVLGAPAPLPAAMDAAGTASSYWLSTITRQGTVAYGNASHQVFRNVKDFGAAGDVSILFSFVLRNFAASGANIETSLTDISAFNYLPKHLLTFL